MFEQADSAGAPFRLPRAAYLHGVFLFAVLSWMSLTRGPWLDEFWSVYLSDPTLGLHRIFSERWMADVHPVFFSLLSYLVAHIAPLTVQDGRLLNFIPLLATVAYISVFWILNPREREFLLVFAVSTSTSLFFINAFGNFRSYFTSICAFFLLLVILRRMSDTEVQLEGKNRILVWSGFFLALTLCLNVHYVTALITAVTVAVFAFGFLLSGRRTDFFLLAVAGLAASLPLGLNLLLQQTQLLESSKGFWITTTSVEAIVVYAVAFIFTVKQNVFLSLMASAAFINTRWNRKREPAPRVRLGRKSFLSPLLISLAVSLAILFAINTRIPIVSMGYLTPIQVIIVATFSAIACQLICRHVVLRAVFFVAAAITLVQTAWTTGHEGRWNQSAAVVRADLESCPSSRVFPIYPADSIVAAPNEMTVKTLAYQSVASKWGIPIEKMNATQSETPATLCPDIFWMEHYWENDKTNADMISDILLPIWPGLRGCTISVRHPEKGTGIIFKVTGNQPGCQRPRNESSEISTLSLRQSEDGKHSLKAAREAEPAAH
ncbi:hypothetical protein HDIA_1090 [Hartmannibacter diazotrophicus]|uniref:Glycosyltransferase RgtA/B/C/D-like domain-containing protein n=1 Tax=Hartmannibacter diazotrophicus TaxID=1482074 RepID=A0A2C9D4D2_9HYPH|nr:hypothetical protein [Hartmannibacter diazotrophicus]SON54631.1 hypothetical protein HDIA_1090 [Hartmannibacter diazotrophicus]